MKTITDYKVGELLTHKDETIRRLAQSILKQMQRLSLQANQTNDVWND